MSTFADFQKLVARYYVECYGEDSNVKIGPETLVMEVFDDVARSEFSSWLANTSKLHVNVKEVAPRSTFESLFQSLNKGADNNDDDEMPSLEPVKVEPASVPVVHSPSPIVQPLIHILPPPPPPHHHHQHHHEHQVEEDASYLRGQAIFIALSRQFGTLESVSRVMSEWNRGMLSGFVEESRRHANKDVAL